MLIQSAQQQNSSINAGFDQSRLFLVPYSDICIDESLIVTAFASTRLMAAIPFITSPGNYSCRMSSYTVSSVFEDVGGAFPSPSGRGEPPLLASMVCHAILFGM